MTNALLVALLSLLLVGCDQPKPALSNKEIAASVEFCRSHHLKPHAYTENAANSDWSITKVQCEP